LERQELTRKAATAKMELKTATAVATAKDSQAKPEEKVKQRSQILLKSHRERGLIFTNSMKKSFEYEEAWVHPETSDNRKVSIQTEAILYVIYDLPCFFSRAKLEVFLGYRANNYNIAVKRIHIIISCAHYDITRCVIEMCHNTCHITNKYMRQHNLFIS
jgi:hypothetical protein